MTKEEMIEMLEGVPSAVGVYYIYDSNGMLIYVGKSIDIRKRLLQHFRSSDFKERKIQRAASKVTFELTGHELLALLHESDLIKKHQPLYNRAQRRTHYGFGLYLHLNPQGYQVLKIESLDPEREELMLFSSYQEGKEQLFRITEEYQLCQKINGLHNSKKSCFQYMLKACKGACIAVESPEDYNLRVNAFAVSSELPTGEIFLEFLGRTPEEKGLVYLQDGRYLGFGYCAKQIRSKKKKREAIVSKMDNRDVRRILKRHFMLHPL
ncbi:GIY-YIG nuclease family protein [Sphingobacterium sp. N143]|uniref:GIY-YIG nuclease family protein n=1 Tax=Sphingobacterium sp. N143 TaxID=2746727 RepID=UPI00257609C4|nr:GIY-YIG nuclease family protein [Sphingobacterium sp. N143]